MKNTLFTFLFFFLQISSTFSQSESDSLLRRIQSDLSDRERLETLIALGEFFAETAPDSALLFANQGEKLAKKAENIPARIRLESIISSANWTIGNYSAGLAAAREELRLARQIADTFAIGGGLTSISNIYFETGREAEGLQFRKEALLFAGNDPFILGQMLLNIGDDYRLSKQFSEALFYTDSAKRLFLRSEDTFFRAFCRLNTGEIFLDSGLYDRAIIELEGAREAFSAEEDLIYLCYSLCDLGDAYACKNDKESALSHYTQAIEIARKVRSGPELSRLNEKMAALFAENGDHESAYRYFREHKFFSDSVSAEHQQKNIRLTEARLRFAERQKEWQLLSRENELSRENLQQKEYAITLLLLALGLISALTLSLILQNRQKHSANRRLSLQNEEIKAQQQEISAQKENIESVNRSLEEKNQKLDEINTEKNELIGIVAHDLKSPLNQINGLIELIGIDENELSGDQSEYLSLINKSSDRLKTMINHMLDIRAIEAQQFNLKMEKQDAVAAIKMVCARFEHLAENKQIRLICELPDVPVFARFDRNNYAQIIENLISNALKFSMPGTEVRMSVQQIEDKVICSVKDQGPGISEKDRKKLFTAYQKLSARPTGGETSSGLGLFIVKKYAEQMSGSVGCESLPGEGSRFFLTLPAS